MGANQVKNWQNWFGLKCWLMRCGGKMHIIEGWKCVQCGKVQHWEDEWTNLNGRG